MVRKWNHQKDINDLRQKFLTKTTPVHHYGEYQVIKVTLWLTLAKIWAVHTFFPLETMK